MADSFYIYCGTTDCTLVLITDAFEQIRQGFVPLMSAFVPCRVVHSVHVIFYLENTVYNGLKCVGFLKWPCLVLIGM